MNGVSVGAVNGARAAYEIHNSSSNQENQTFDKVNGNNVQTKQASNVRAPLSNLPPDRTEFSEHDHTVSQRTHDRVEGMEQVRAKVRNPHEVESQHRIHKRNISNGNLSSADSDVPENMYRPDKEDREGWIHREKLAKIENEELQAAGINLAKARTRSREALGGRRTSSRDRLRNDFGADSGSRGEKRRKVSSPIPKQLDDNEDGEEKQFWDLRTPEEIAADQTSPQIYTTPVLRKSGSKIPVLSPSANAVQSEKSERETPEPRKRTTSSSASNEDGLHSPKLRSNSSKWADDEGVVPVVAGKSSSPTRPKQRSTSGSQSIPVASKSAVPRKTSTSRTPASRPRTRGNDTDRPRTSTNAPEGDPPWLADMYKPDPRLPPDQQLIPTLAKKQRQMQWEENGMIPRVYDREFSALAVHEDNEPARPEPAETEDIVEKNENSESWPLKPLTNVRSPRESAPKTNSTNAPAATGGYSTMPKVSSPPMSMTSPKIGTSTSGTMGPQSPKAGPPRQTSATQQQGQKIQQRPMLDDEDEKVEKKGCGCCVVM